MQAAFFIIAALIVIGGLAAMLVRKLVHAVLWLMVTLASLAALFLLLGAQFVGFAQILVYVGAVAILIVFAILLTRNSEWAKAGRLASPSWLVGVGIAGLATGCLIASILASSIPPGVPVPPAASVADIGQKLMTEYVLPLEAVGLLLTAAMIGAVIIAMPEDKRG
ncbi:MAG: NADH-quinone oxidoreductase subunit J [Candidatus Omnitrophica bacterium]|nr:NADH-quinone oxidoreductase subunit J [Candidatus Omnitrophota bacterium]